MPVAGDFAVRNLLHGAVDGVEEGCRFVGAGHGGESTVRVYFQEFLPAKVVRVG